MDNLPPSPLSPAPWTWNHAIDSNSNGRVVGEGCEFEGLVAGQPIGVIPSTLGACVPADQIVQLADPNCRDGLAQRVAESPAGGSICFYEPEELDIDDDATPDAVELLYYYGPFGQPVDIPVHYPGDVRDPAERETFMMELKDEVHAKTLDEHTHLRHLMFDQQLRYADEVEPWLADGDLPSEGAGYEPSVERLLEVQRARRQVGSTGRPPYEEIRRYDWGWPGEQHRTLELFLD